MSLARTALRIAAVAAMQADPVLAALVGDRIFDSRISIVDFVEPVPVITVLTEDDSGDAYSANNGGPPFDEHCDLLLEISLRGAVALDGDTVTIEFAVTDSEMEAKIDLLEQRAVYALTWAPTPQSKLLRDAVTRRVSSFKSSRFASGETGVRLAVRMLHLTVELKSYEPDDPRDPPTGPFASLPEPLRTVASALPSNSVMLPLCQMLAAGIAAPGAVTLFTGTDLVLAPRLSIDPAAPPLKTDPNPTIGITLTPDPNACEDPA